jgi:hypothetical protein
VLERSWFTSKTKGTRRYVPDAKNIWITVQFLRKSNDAIYIRPGCEKDYGSLEEDFRNCHHHPPSSLEEHELQLITHFVVVATKKSIQLIVFFAWYAAYLRRWSQYSIRC